MVNSTLSPVILPSELSIRISAFGLVMYQGTSAMLEAEGLIPANTKWPDGFKDLHWTNGIYRYWVVRHRPDGVKGSKKLLANIDWWCVRQQLIFRDHAACELELKRQEMAECAYRNSEKGRKEYAKRFESYMAAHADENFQKFKALIPGLIKPKRGRRTKNIGQTQGATA